jgi:hypothetical protein
MEKSENIYNILHKENYSKMTSPSYMASKDDNE